MRFKFLFLFVIVVGAVALSRINFAYAFDFVYDRILWLLEDEPSCESTVDEKAYLDFGYKWTRITCKAPFAPRDGAGAFVFLDSMWLVGGWNNIDKKIFPRVCNNDVWRSDGHDWVEIRPNEIVDPTFDGQRIWEGRHNAGYVNFEGKMWIIGGDANQGHYHRDIWSSSDGKNWLLVNKTNPVPWGPRVLFLTLNFKNQLWIMGGQTIPQIAQADDKVYDDAWNSTDGVNWKRVDSLGPHWSPRSIAENGVVFQDKMWVIGGATYYTPQNPRRKYFNDIWNTNDGIHWNLVTSKAPWEPRQFHITTVFDNKIWVIGGHHRTGGNKNDVWFSSNGIDWTELPDTPWDGRHSPSVFVYKGSLWVVAGQNMESDVWRLSKINQPR